MSYQVFISHSSKNADVASAMKSYLEARGIKCWKAPEDIPYGTDWDVGIVNGLSQCSVMVLIFSKEADDSGHVKRELVFADNQKKVIIPFKIDGYMPSNLAYFLALPQWLDGIMDIEAAFGDLYNRLKTTLCLEESFASSQPVVIQPIHTVQSAPQKPATQAHQPSQSDIDTLLTILPEYSNWATNSDIRTRLGWDKPRLKLVLEHLERSGQLIYRDGSGGAIAIRSQELTELESRLTNGQEAYPFFVNVGEGRHRHWDDFRRYNFFSAGYGERFANLMKAIPVGSEVYVYLSQHGYVGKANTKSLAVPIRDFTINGTPISTLPLVAPEALTEIGDLEKCEWLVGVDWIKALDREYAIKQKGLFVHVATSCRIKDPITIKYLREAFAKA